jgi:hypothetical protein
MLRETGHSLIFGSKERAIRVGADEITLNNHGIRGRLATSHSPVSPKNHEQISIINYIRYNDTVLAILEYSGGLVRTGEKVKGESE